MGLFRSSPFWQAALMTLPDEAFFELLRSVLGTVKTPFNKQRLLEELTCFIARSDIQEIMASYLDSRDRKIIAAIALLEEPAPGELESFFTGEFSYAELQGTLLNLEERLIIYRFRDGDSPAEKPALRIGLNPRLETILAPLAADKGILFPALAADTKTEAPEGPGRITLDGRTLAALVAFLISGEAQVKGEGPEPEFRKKTADSGRRLFPGLDLEAAAGAFLNLGIIVQEGERFLPLEAKLLAFRELTHQSRLEYLAAGMAIFFQRNAPARAAGSSGKIVLPPGKTALRGTGRLIHALLSHMAPEGSETGRYFPGTTLCKLAELFRRREEADRFFTGQELPSPGILLQSLRETGLLELRIAADTEVYRPVFYGTEPDGFSLDGPEPENTKPRIAMDSSFSCILYPEISFADALDLASCAVLEETGAAPRLTLSRPSVVRGFNRHYNAAFLWELLRRLSGGRLPDALKWNLDDWEKRWREVSLYQGTVLTLNGGRTYLAENGPLKRLVRETLAPGIYLLSAGPEEAAGVLAEAGVDIVGRPGERALSAATFPSLRENEGFGPQRAASPGGAEQAAAPFTAADPQTAPAAAGPAVGAVASAEAAQERFRAVLGNLTITKQEREELESRIARRMILSESQLRDASLRHEKLEARSLDYVGKTGIVKQAIASGSLLEVSCLGGKQTVLGKPESLDKKKGEMVLSIQPREGGEPLAIPLGKISLVRRIKQSIFGEI